MTPPRLALLDYDAGNLRSVSRALEVAGAQVEIVTSWDQVDAAPPAALVLPGQGHFRDCQEKLVARGLWPLCLDWLSRGRPFLGICVGYQLLFESSEEAPGTPGMGFYAGTVKKFKARRDVKVPHMGWDTLRFTQPVAPLWRGLPAEPSVYYAHSYYPAPADPALAAAVTDYGGVSFAAALADGPVAAVQFHPEKSQEVGLTILRNFVASLPPAAVQDV
ncbi:MAG: imidazole glycerol phosphate synthase subunit HisH [Verrucomicrobia bacterium]|nr:imidazole glycerol phosphate synthase subunit HisH [Verrucomicrobiota bacterium]